MAVLNSRWGIAVIALVSAMLIGVFVFNRGYGELTPRGYSYSMSLFSACNRKDSAKILQLQDLIQKDLKTNDLTAIEGRWLSAIIDKALAGDWDSSVRKVRQLMEDQIVAAQPLD